MDPLIGKTLSHYRIVEKIGAGGMGEVYRAHDSRLGRDVAIKVLPPHLPAPPEVRARFEHEARTISQLNHPHICTLYDVGCDAGTDYLVMELVEGETLAQRLQKGPLPTTDVLRLGAQIADALDRAHHAGVVHRDLKPGNVMISKNGAKLLDFGLARAMGVGGAPAGQTDSPTLSSPITTEGAIVGTVQYMAPEQLEGKEADARADLFALGTMLYEMATGRKVFEGTSQAGLIAAILKEEPRPMAELEPQTPPALERAVKRCLAKDRDERWQTARDLAHELKWVLEEESPVTSTHAMSAPPSSHLWGPKGHVLWIAAASALALVVVALFVLSKGPPRLNPKMTLRTLELPFVEINYPGMSSDGKWIALPATDGRGRWALYFMNLGGGEPREIVTAAPGGVITAVDVSPDGSQLAYAANYAWQLSRSEILVAPSLGGSSRGVAREAWSPRWSPDGNRIGYMRLGGGASQSGKQEFWSVRSDGSDSRLEFVDSLSTGANRNTFAWSPDGKQVVWTRGFENEQYQELVIRTLDTGAERQLTHDAAQIDEVWWTRQDDLVFSSNRAGNTNLWMMRASGGSPIQVTKGVGPDMGMRVSADGKTLLCLQQHGAIHLWIGDLKSGGATQVTQDERDLGRPGLSPDGRQIVVSVRSSDPLGGRGTIEVMNRDGSARRTLVSRLVRPLAADWSPGGRWIAYSASSGGWGFDSDIYVVDTSGVAPRRVGSGAGVCWVNDSTLMAVRVRNRGPQSLLTSARSGAEVGSSADSTLEWPMRDGGVLMMDMRNGREGWWHRMPGSDAGTTPAGRLIAPLSVNAVAVSPDTRFLLCVPEVGKVIKIHLPSGRREPIPGTFPGLAPYNSGGWSLSTGRISADGHEFVYRRPAVNSKLVLIENLR